MTQVTSSIEVDDAKIRRALKGIKASAEDMRKGFMIFHQYMRVRTDSMFGRLRRGGTHRGVRWKYFAPQYIRKDGTVVPAWGGVKKVRGSGTVLGRLRPSGQRVSQGDSILQDTGTLRSRAALVQSMTKNVLVMGPNGLIYSAPQHRRRPFLFFEVPRDLSKLTDIMIKQIRTGAKRGG